MVPGVNLEQDLQQLFAGEVQERTARLMAGAEAMAAGHLDEETLQTMIREGHTLKGTARMMGFAAISDAGKALEDAWRAVAAGEIVADGEGASAPALLAGGVGAGGGGGPAPGTPPPPPASPPGCGRCAGRSARRSRSCPRHGRRIPRATSTDSSALSTPGRSE